jgi:hypothetical protein
LGLVSGARGLSSRHAERTLETGGNPSNLNQVTGSSCEARIFEEFKLVGQSHLQEGTGTGTCSGPALR